MTAPGQDLRGAERRRGIIVGLARALGSTTVLIALYYLAPLDRLTGVTMALFLVAGLLLLVGMIAYQVHAILDAAYPGMRGVEALATTVPLYLLLFAAAYFLMSNDGGGDFNVSVLNRTDSLYFTVTVFTTVGFGDITPASEAARLAVTAQMILNLVVLGIGVRLILGAVRRARHDIKNVGEPKDQP